MDTQRFSYTSPKLELRSCPEKGGFGLFACQPIAAGELLAMWGGQVVTTEQLEELPVERQTHGIRTGDGQHEQETHALDQARCHAVT